MKSYMRPCSQRCGFTLVELLTTIAVIAILISLLVPTLSLIQKMAFKVKQKSQFQSIGIALEGFQTDFGDYPESFYNHLDGGYCGAQKLAEAIVGWDGFGVHPQTGFRFDGTNDIDIDGDGLLDFVKVYDIANGIDNGNYQTAEENRAVRKGPYLELEAANAVKISDLYASQPGTLEPGTFVLADMFGKVRHRTTQKKTGMPILYFKAYTRGTRHDSNAVAVAPDKLVFNIRDNREIYTANAPFGGSNNSHALSDASEQIFYRDTTNPNYPGSAINPATDPPRPYRSESFILLSAGPDGLYGTADDVYNFDTEK